MTVIAATLFAAALALSCLTIFASIAGKWDRIIDVATEQGVPAQRIIRLGVQRYTGARLRVVVDNGPAPVAALEQVRLAA